ncbi:60S ribosomal protein L36 [Skeletonema marinoi]|uniref:60S ribosomal protein L36 n=2 Tax=Skeletonema marinoi TaxID=267567 RepID=A0AAD8Y0T0_9STRA|nr:60S ribosomal protein L36 [Skeletonema marinoi]|mmetsp:Transcript_9593/g.14385  ORF Transcript_9593/g.14385 Transcript_9593/m.14385 type:complete len:108 (+) Transcript_9593:48-371(+)|eukprot:CAMPEP_0113402690 /NCGR_PEP_ID=MMETSP0013_2-20120614/17404_1 /TAXON_ID=2843 ORGANISM="Skeletonema costatum, Strain 1716" /NCGR_SAMPLE_ID=MMETSP0013_2 /ASSEMBLY_ACC=CAM_ASM_000158 /LENGTH=107 /DNA_ID=CAMNT_0000288069 /DNA_START=63 /DNA_END=386 /DNA_ORIENTATION=- /assembly_acc=CAM_ASM_000158
MARNGIAKGANSGFVTEKRERAARPSRSTGKLGKRTALCREIAREVAGLSPYERRILDMIKTGGSAADKRIYKFAKRRLGSHKRAVAKREDIKAVNSKMRAKQAGAN